MAAREERLEVRFPLLDVMRLVAVIGVVWLHVHVGGQGPLAATKELGRAAVPFFACAAVYFAYGTLRRHPRLTLAAYGLSRFWRVYFVFLVWSAIYLGVRWANALFVSHTGRVKTSLVDFFWNGEAFQLWFLAFIFPACVAAYGVALLTRARPALRLPLALVLVMLAILLVITPEPAGLRASLDYAAANGYITLPSCFLALALALVENPEESAVERAGPRCYIGAALALTWLVLGLLVDPHDRALETAGGFGLLLFGLGWSSRGQRPVASHAGALAFGTYLVHLLFLETIEQLLPKFGWDERAAGVELAVFAVTLIGSVALVELLRATRWTRWLAG